jgi:hypothetical protein
VGGPHILNRLKRNCYPSFLRIVCKINEISVPVSMYVCMLDVPE